MTDLGSITDREFAGLEFAAATDNEIFRETSQNLPLSLPWKRKVVRLGTCFQSSRQSSEDPWLEDSPFMWADLVMIPKVLSREDGAQATHKSVTTASRTQTGDHLSLGFGVGVGLPFLASISVKGTYDKDVQENRDSDKTSVRSSVRAGTVELDRQPQLSIEAKTMLKHGGGYAAFCQRYGDYYVAGYRLGGENGLLVSACGYSTKQVETFGITVTLEVLFVEVSTSYSKDVQNYASGKTLKLLGYDTLDGLNWNTKTTSGDFMTFYKQRQDILVRSECILERVQAGLAAQNLHEGHYLTHQQCDKLIESGLVIELMLLPMSNIRDVARWTTSSDVI